MHTKQKILQISKSRLLTFGLAIFINVLLAGSVCGTFAWYTYATRTGFQEEYHGTTVGDLGSLQAGIVSDIQLPDYLNYELAEDDVTLASEGKYIYWCREVIKAETINYVLTNNGSATTRLSPVTSASFDDFDNPDSFQLYRAPLINSNYSVGNTNDYAARSSYVYIPFVFRYEDDINPGNYLPNREIRLSECNVSTMMDGDGKELYKAVRLYANNGEHGYIINPTSEQDGTNNVGGILDLDHSGFYDYDGNLKEVVYGESVSTSYLDEPTEADGTLPQEDITSFVSNHKHGVFALDEDTFEPKKVSYHRLSKFTDNEIAITTTDANFYNMARLDLTIYIEGWDLHVVDNEKDSGFNIDFSFEIEL